MKRTEIHLLLNGPELQRQDINSGVQELWCRPPYSVFEGVSVGKCMMRGTAQDIHILQPAICDIGKLVTVCSLEKGNFVEKTGSS